ncbi:hypothetical protein [Pseudomonas alkylphenolica]|uniref:hypothetical protein n=1 Tax=Pseudomonas alkylphenolica TaxID=237609 RepID=UPI001E328D5C|nr:hypothetical protein [Pseudomonas alkylphenolica]
MFILRIVSCITLMVALQAQALPTTTLSPEQHLALGRQLAEHAGASQWQQLWQRSRQAGHLLENPDVPYFSLAPPQLIDSLRLTLSQPDQTQPHNQTQAMYRRDFSPQTVGKQGNTSYTAICLWVDWRTLPEHAVNRPTPWLGQISLLLTRPCQ